jgi:hypothetical protein
MHIRIPIKLRKIKDSGKKKLFIVPYIFTFANACFGLLAVLSRGTIFIRMRHYVLFTPRVQMLSMDDWLAYLIPAVLWVWNWIPCVTPIILFCTGGSYVRLIFTSLWCNRKYCFRNLFMRRSF